MNDQITYGECKHGLNMQNCPDCAIDSRNHVLESSKKVVQTCEGCGLYISTSVNKNEDQNVCAKLAVNINLWNELDNFISKPSKPNECKYYKKEQ